MVGAVDSLTDSYLFDRLDPKLVSRVDKIARVAAYAAGDTIFAEHQVAEDLYVLRRGRVTLTFGFPHHGQILHVAITTVRPGEVFGWSALTETRRFSARAQADVACEVIQLDGGQLREILDQEPRLGYEVMGRLNELISNRLRDSRERLRMLLQW